VNHMENHILHVKGILNDEECESLIKESIARKDFVEYEQCPHAQTGIMTRSTFSVVQLQPQTKVFDLIHNKTKDMIRLWVKHLKSLQTVHTYALVNNLTHSHKYRLMCYEVGGWIHPHTDWDHFTHGSCTFNLNDDYEGGEFCFFNDNYQVRLGRGDGLIFPADPFWVHEVKEITEGKRYSCNSFITSLPEEKRIEINSFARNIKEPDCPLAYNFGNELFDILRKVD
jgi:predicted 2-oxoglutarate/Fe(II)-dependent dioxygenase YbiX